jgi:hypothetical protein
MYKSVVGVGVVAIALSGCAGRAPQIIPLVQVSDTQLSCTQIQSETKTNNDRISALATEQGWKMGQNAVAGVVGFLVWPAWLGLDLQDAAGKEAHALSQRNEYLNSLAQDRCQPAMQTASARGSPLALMPMDTIVSSTELSSSLVSH